MDERAPRLALLRLFIDGNAPLPEGAEGVREAYRAFQRIARSNYGEVVTDATGERMTPSIIRVGKSTEDDDKARKLWKNNRLDVWATDVHRDMLALSKGYVTVQKDAETDEVEVVYERPEQCYVEHDPSRPDKRRAGVKVYRDLVEKRDYAYLHLPGKPSGTVWRFWRACYDSTVVLARPRLIERFQGGWQPDAEFNLVPIDAEPDDIGPGRPTGLTVVPIVPFINRGELGEYETHIDLLNRINWVILQRLVITAIQAYKQRALKGDLPETDEDGNNIDYGEMFKPGAGSLWRLPEGVELWESGQTDISGILESAKADILELAASTRTPMSALMPESTNQSAEGASFAREGLVFKANDRIARAKSSWVEVVKLMLTLANGEEPEEVDVDFLPAERQSMAERYDALSKAGTDVPWRTKMSDILGFDGAKIDRMAVERAEDAMFTATLAPPTPPAVAPGTVAPKPAEGTPPNVVPNAA
jgi:hypothetical protein